MSTYQFLPHVNLDIEAGARIILIRITMVYSKKLRAEDEDEFKCRKCDNGGNLVHPEAKFVELDDGSKFECVDKILLPW